MKNNLDQVLFAISKMNIPLLREILDPVLSYQDVDLGIFLRQLDSIFEEFKEDGAEELISLEGACVNLQCNPNQNRTTYRFYSKESRDYIDFRFILEPINESKNHRITDIFQCHCFKSQAEQNGWYGEEKYLFFYRDEKNDFSNNPDFLVHKELAIQANEYWKKSYETINLEEIEAWLIKFQSSFDFISNFESPPMFERMTWDNFYSDYKTLKDYYEIIPQVVQLFQMIDPKRDNHSEKELIGMVLKFENYFWDTEYDYFFQKVNEKNEFEIRFGKNEIKGGIIDIFIELWNWFLPTRKKLVEKYFALTEGELDQFYESEEYYFHELELERLGFHMDIRERARLRGEYIPLR